MVPASPDYFSVMAINALAKVLPRWKMWSDQAAKLQVLCDATYPYPGLSPRFLGTVIQNYRPRKGKATVGFQRWIDEIAKAVQNQLVPNLKEAGMLLPAQAYSAAGIASDHCLVEIPDFNTLIAKAQAAQTPVFDLSKEQINEVGVVLDQQLDKKQQFHKLFDDLAVRVLELTNEQNS